MDQSSLPLSFFTNPLNIQGVVLDEFTARLGNGQPIVDANNVFCFLLEQFSTITANSANASWNSIETLYPTRARTVSDLYRRMSNYDYLGLFSSPATTTISLTLDKNFLVRNALPYQTLNSKGEYADTDYDAVIIPRNSIFTISQYKFGLYYPIIIKINKITKSINVAYDDQPPNKLHVLSSNTLEYRNVNYSGMNLIAIKIPLTQFEKYVVEEDLVASTGFIKAYDYINKFYAARIFSYQPSIVDPTRYEWVEVNQTLSEDTYDPENLTVLLTVLSDVNKLKIVVPQIYFTKGIAGSKLRIEIYNTLGAIDADVSTVDPASISISFNSINGSANEVKHSQIINKLNTIGTNLLSTKIVGGGNGLTVAELRDRVINNTFDDSPMITADDLTKHFSNIGFKVQKYQDGITKRIYHAFKPLTDLSGINISAASIPVVFDNTVLNNTGSIINANDGSYTVLPSTLYRYDNTYKVSRVVNDSDRTNLDSYASANAALVKAMNNDPASALAGTYLVSPFHLRIDTNDQYPLAYSYNLNQPSIDEIEFVNENELISTQVSAFSASIQHGNNGTSGYDITVTIAKTEDLSAIVPRANNSNFDNIILLARTVSYTGQLIWIKARYVGELNGRDAFTFHIHPIYQITADHSIAIDREYDTQGNIVSAWSDDFGVASHILPLNANTAFWKNIYGERDVLFPSHKTSSSTQFNLLFMVNKNVTALSLDPDIIYTSGAIAATTIPIEFIDFIPLVSQTLHVTLGELVTQTQNSVDVLYSQQEYQKWQDTEFAAYPHDVYEIDPLTGVPSYTISDGHVVLTKTHSKGEVMTSPYMTVGGTYFDGNDNVLTEINGVYKLATDTALPYATNAWRPISIPTGSGTTSFTSGSLVNDILTIEHSYGNIEFTTVDLLNATSNEIVPKSITYETNKIKVDLSTSNNVTGTCTYRFSFSTSRLDVKNLLELGVSMAVTVADRDALLALTATDILFVWVTAVSEEDDSSVAVIVPDVDSLAILGDGGALYYYNKDATSQDKWVKWIVASDLATVDNWVTSRVALYESLQAAVAVAETVANFAALPSPHVTDHDYIWVTDASGDTYEDNGDTLVTAPEVPLATPALGTGGALYYWDSVGAAWVRWIDASELALISEWAKNQLFIGIAYAGYTSDVATDPLYLNILTYDPDVSWNSVGRWPWECTTDWYRLTDDTYLSAVISNDITFSLNRLNDPLIIHTYGDPVLNAAGMPIITAARELLYHIDMIQVDAKLKYSGQKEHLNYLDDLRSLLMSYFNAVNASSGKLLENTKLYFKPTRSIGTALFKRNDVSNVELPLEFSMSLKLYVYPFVVEDAQVTALVRSSILSIIDRHVQSGTISCSAITKDILDTMSDNVKYADVLGINNDTNTDATLQTLICLESDAQPHLRQILKQDIVGAVTVDRALTLEFITVD